MKQLREASLEALDQVCQLLGGVSPGLYGQTTEFSSSTIGAHVRHVVDHYLALRAGIDNSGLKGDGRNDSPSTNSPRAKPPNTNPPSTRPRINFNCRNRNSTVERDIHVARAMLAELSSWLCNFELVDCELEVESEISLSTTCNKVFTSTLSRELCYLINHTVHHAAYMSVIAKQLGIVVESSVGVAPATGSFLRMVEGAKQG